MTIALKLRSGALVHECEMPSAPDIIVLDGKHFVRAGQQEGRATYLDASVVNLEGKPAGATA